MVASVNPLLDIRIGTIVEANGPDPVGYVRRILPHGFESLALTFGTRWREVNLPDLAARIREAIGDADVTVGAIGLYGNPLEYGPQDEEVRRGWELLIDHAHLFGTDIVAGFAGRLRGRPIDESIPRFKEVFGPLAQRAADLGVRIAFENCAMDGNWRTGDWNIAHGPDAWELMFDALPHENLGLEWEPCHQMLNLIEPVPQLRKWASRIFHLHGKCATIRWDVIREFGVNSSRTYAYHRTPGFGDCNWTDIISELRMAGFRGAIDIEGRHDPVYNGELEMTGQAHALQYLKRCRGGEYVPNPD